MKLLTEISDFNQIENKVFINEETKEKEYWVQGVFMQAEKVNKNKRFYPLKLMEREVNGFQKLIESNQSLGELNHADSINVDYERTCQIIKMLKIEGNDVYGKAKILPTKIGLCLMPLLDEGIRIGESSRALGSMEDSLDGDYKIIKEDFKLITIDVVNNPSAHDAWVEMIKEKTYIIENGIIKEETLSEYDKSINTLKKDELKEGISNLFKQFFNEIKNGK